MLTSFLSWWVARITELLPNNWTNVTARPQDGVVVDCSTGPDIIASVRRNGISEVVNLGAAARLAGHKPILLRPPPGSVLVKSHVVPTAPRRDMDQLLRHELARITPFPVEDLFWRWDSHIRKGDRTRNEVTLTMVPKIALAHVFAILEDVGMKANFIEVGPSDRPILLPVADIPARGNISVLAHGLAFACGGVAVIALLLPFILQSLNLDTTETAISELQPTIKQVDALRRGIAANGAQRDVLAKELERTGDVLQVLATITRILPDDGFLTDFSLRNRQMTISGRITSAPRLITSLSTDPEFQNPAFTAPVTRIEGATLDAFSIKSDIAK